MKAESIEQIREHLAKGGMILRGKSWGTTKWRVYMPPTALDDGWEYELLPLEVKEPVDHGTQHAIDAACGTPTPHQHLLTILRGTATLPESVSAQGHIYHKAQLEAADVIERQQKRIEELERELASVYKVLDAYGCGVSSVCLECGSEDDDCECEESEQDGTQKGQEEKPKRGAWLEFADDGKLVTDVMHEPKDAVMPDSFVWCEEAGIHETEWRQRIRTRLLHGMWPEMSDLMDWWEATTGERIEWGRRCVICDGQGRLKSNSGDKRPGYEYTGCPGCSNGYSVRPTWMGDVNG